MDIELCTIRPTPSSSVDFAHARRGSREQREGMVSMMDEGELIVMCESGGLLNEDQFPTQESSASGSRRMPSLDLEDELDVTQAAGIVHAFAPHSSSSQSHDSAETRTKPYVISIGCEVIRLGPDPDVRR
jgi:hypothetical protein